MKMVKRILQWVVTVLFGIMALASLPHLSAVFGMLTVALLFPIEKWQVMIKKVIHGKWKAILAVVLVTATLVTLPVSDVTEPMGASGSESTTIVSTVSTTAESTTAFVAEEATSTTKKITTQQATITTKTTTITKTPTTTKAPTTTTKAPTTTTRPTTKAATTTKITTTTKKTTTVADPEITYVLNTHTKKFHSIFCSKLPTKNRQDTTKSREEIIDMGYSPCGICKP